MKKRFITTLAVLVSGGLFADDVTLEWNPNPADEQVTQYLVHQSDDILGPWVVVASVTSTNVTVDVTRAVHFFYVSAVNFWGESPPSSAVGIPAGGTPPTGLIIRIP